ncbi:Alcohol dehydrogenase [Leptospirillum ferriphilum]|uniref:alcohol dehydrogenase n=2 Tax=Leptospirillum TaxID=179 RepID=A0A094X9C5_9BACT|nr:MULTISPECIES: zinc-dependent alcohol dehydrogenase family protein [Leptospirillum]AKS22792.1 alcohol dehydrogenase [Leptospirillum sp. Group II 'CF-1']EDZ39457.1 MAG: Alcohol dehydrogenase [Leptospirillum sp. Group II '5-way CG']EIJ77026.1 MAG: Alcohol dehydrogenase [Leptospirillum sp. Group II 'C75']KGA95139.1 Alcohol dehydrogenase [Leptospirillum ferriphilum]
MKKIVVARVGPLGSDSLRMETSPEPVPGSGEVLVRVEACGVCRTDLHVIEGDLPESTPGIVPGHEVVGRIAKTGPGVSEFSPGQRVGVAWLYRSCGRCRYCRKGAENLCVSPLFTGYHRPGGYAEALVADAAFVYPLPEGLPAEQIAPLLCAGIIGYRAFSRLDLPRGSHLGLYGFGASAHLVLQMARDQGMRISVGSRGERHQAFARSMGADWVGGPADTPEDPLDGAILFAPAGPLVLPILRRLDRGGRLLIAGIHLSDIPSIEYEHFLFYEKSLGSVTANTREDGRKLLEWASKGSIVPRTTVYPLEEAVRALRDLKEDRVEGAAVLKVGG